jgi:hypothetical protein
LERAQQCRGIADAMNPPLVAMDGELTAKPVGWAMLDHRLKSVSQTLSMLHPEEPKLQQAISAIVDNFATARAAASLGMQCRSSGDNDEAAVAQWITARNRHANIVRGLQHYCRNN